MVKAYDCTGRLSGLNMYKCMSLKLMMFKGTSFFSKSILGDYWQTTAFAQLEIKTECASCENMQSKVSCLHFYVVCLHSQLPLLKLPIVKNIPLALNMAL